MRELSEAEKAIITKNDLLYEQRMTRVETTLEGMVYEIQEMRKDMKSDFRWLFLLMMIGFGGLFGLMAHGFKWF